MTHDHAADLDELLELDGVVLHDYLTDLTAWAAERAGDVRRILDLGAGTGTGTVALAQRFGTASVVAVDMSDTRLARIRAKAAELGLAERVSTIEADVAAEWPTLEPVDLVWAANCVHEFPDPDRVLKDVYATLRPGGVLAVSEMDSLPRFLPGDDESRWHQAMGQTFGEDWAPRLAQAGFTVGEVRTFPIEVPPMRSSARYAEAYLRTVRHRLDGELSAEDVALIDGVGGRDDIVVRGSRTTWLARRQE